MATTKEDDTKALEHANIHMNINGKLTFHTGRSMCHIIDANNISSVRLGIETIDNSDGRTYRAIYLGIQYGHSSRGDEFHRERTIDHLPVVVANRIYAEILHLLTSN